MSNENMSTVSGTPEMETVILAETPVEEKVVVELETDSDLPKGYIEKFSDTPVHLRDYAPLFKEFYRMYRDEYPVYYNRSAMWEAFGNVVNMHIMEYTVPQYGDYPNDLRTNSSVNDILDCIRRYVARFDNNSRGADERLLDLIKIANYAGMAYMKSRGYEEIFNILPPKTEDVVTASGEAHLVEDSPEETVATEAA